jgi:hypothetical protein
VTATAFFIYLSDIIKDNIHVAQFIIFVIIAEKCISLFKLDRVKLTYYHISQRIFNMQPTEKQCQAYATYSLARCTKKPLLGSRYCFWHQSWGVWGVNAVVGSVLAIILFIFGPFYGDVYNYYFPSKEITKLDNLDDKVEDIDSKSEKRDKEHTLKLDELLALQGNEAARKEYLALLKKLNESNSEDLSKQSDVPLNKDLILEQRKNIRKTEEINDEIKKKTTVKVELKYMPAIYQMLRLLDIEMQKWQEKGYITKIDAKDPLPIFVFDTNTSTDTIRKYTLKDGSFIEVIRKQGKVNSGNSISPLEILICFEKPMHNSKKLFDFNFSHLNMYILDRITKPGDNYIRFKTDKKPLEEDDFIKTLSTIMKNVKDYTLVNSDTEI